MTKKVLRAKGGRLPTGTWVGRTKVAGYRKMEYGCIPTSFGQVAEVEEKSVTAAYSVHYYCACMNTNGKRVPCAPLTNHAAQGNPARTFWFPDEVVVLSAAEVKRRKQFHQRKAILGKGEKWL